MATATATVTSWFQTFITRLLAILRQERPTPIEFLGAVAKTAWGLWLLNPMWDTFEGSRVYHVMAILGPEWFWGGLFAFLGIVHLWIIAHGTYRLRFYASGMAVVVWTFIAAMVAVGHFASTGTPIYTIFAAFEIWAWWRVADMANKE